MIELGVTQPVAADCGDADAGDDASLCAEEPKQLEQAWAKLHDKDLVDASAIAPGTGLTQPFDEESTAGPPASTLAEGVMSPGSPPVHEHAPALDQVLATGAIVSMLDTLVQPAVQPSVPLIAEQTSAEETSAAEQQQQLRVATDAASAIAAMARARPARIRLQDLRQAATAIAAVRRAMLARRTAASRREAALLAAQQRERAAAIAHAASIIAAAARARPARVRLQDLRQAVTAIAAARRAVVVRRRVAAYGSAREQQRLGQYAMFRAVIPVDSARGGCMLVMADGLDLWGLISTPPQSQPGDRLTFAWPRDVELELPDRDDGTIEECLAGDCYWPGACAWRVQEPLTLPSLTWPGDDDAGR